MYSKEQISKSKPMILTIPQHLSYENLIREWRQEGRIVKVVDATLDEPMEVIVRDVVKIEENNKIEETKKYIPPEQPEEKETKKKGQFRKIVEGIIP